MAPLIFLLVALALIGFPVWAIVSIVSLQRRNDRLERRAMELEHQIENLRYSLRTVGPMASVASSEPVAVRREPAVTEPALTPTEPPPASGPRATEMPPVIQPPMAEPPPVHVPEPGPIARPTATEAEPPVMPTSPPGFDWEQFTGTKLLAWTGGAAAFLGAAFFIKYSFEHDLIPPAVRAAIGYLFALGLIVTGLRIPRVRYAVTAQTLCATGVVCLYAVTFACSSIYDFPAFTPLRTLFLMAAITATAFMLAVRLGAQVVAVLGMLGGFLTPVLLSTGRDNAFGLFGYIGLLDVGLVALALHRRWLFLVPLGAAGTVAMQAGWAANFLTQAKTTTAMVVCLVFCVIFLTAHVVAQRFRRAAPQLLWPAIALPCIAFLFALGFVGYRDIAAQPGLLFGFVFAIDACLLGLAWLDEDAPPVHLWGGAAVFALLAIWTEARLTESLLPWALGLYLAHGVVHTAFPLLLERRRPGVGAGGWNQVFPALALLLMLLPLFKLETVTFALWPCVLALDLLAIGLAALTGSIVAVAAALGLTLVVSAVWIVRLPPAADAEWSLLTVVGGFAAVFFAAGVMLLRRLGEANSAETDAGDRRQAQLPALSVLMPFLLLVMMTQRLPLANPSGVLGLGLLLALLCLGLSRALLVAWLPGWALAGVALLEWAWDARHFTRGFDAVPLAWYLAFYAVFALFPFVFRARLAGLTGPWAVAAMSGVVQFPLVYRIVQRTSLHDAMGLVPAFFALAPLASAAAVQRWPAADPRARLNQLAWFGGVALFFITAVPAVQFDREWITLSWALEGAALLWLFRRVPHPGVRAVGAGLLVATFVRLALNPAVLEYHARSAAPIFNWYLYTYGGAIGCFFFGAKRLSPPDDRAFGLRVPPLLYALGTMLAFLLLNIEIADFFSAPGARVLTFQLSGNFARDMTYTIAWALFALGLLLVSIWKHTRTGRYSALALLGVAVVKLFFHDLERLGALHRIGALFAVAIIAIGASLAYQRFLPGPNSTEAKR